MSIPSPKDTIEHLKLLGLGAISLSRLFALRHLSEARMVTKLACSANFVEFIEIAVCVDDFLNRCFQTQLPPAGWPRKFNPEMTGALVQRRVDVPTLDRLLDELKSTIRSLVGHILHEGESSPYHERLSRLLKGFADHQNGSKPTPDAWQALREVDTRTDMHQSVRGPAHVNLDPAFVSDFSLIDRNVPMFGDSPEEVAPYLWCLSIREAVASDTCALTACEYDGLPLQFYRDMAKQSWDEMRHAVSYFQRAEALFPAALQRMEPSDPLRIAIESYISSGTGLIVPREGNLFEMVANADLCERLVLMNIRVETPAIARLRQKINSPFSNKDIALKRLFEYDRHDETSHSRIGIYWLNYLVPSAKDRRELMQRVDEMRAFLLLTAFVHHDGLPLARLVSHYLKTASEPSQATERFNGWSRGYA
jgi:hypothetical protein